MTTNTDGNGTNEIVNGIEQMRGTDCDPGHHEGPIDVRITMGKEVQVDKFCETCGIELEGWTYSPRVESIEIHLSNGETERFNRSADTDDKRGESNK